MAAKSELSIRAAVMHCLARCAESQAPLCCLGEFLENLQGMGWEADDVRAVETVVLKLLGRLRETEKSLADPLSVQADSLSSARPV